MTKIDISIKDTLKYIFKAESYPYVHLADLQNLTISQALEVLQKDGFSVSPQKLREYENQGFLKPNKSESDYRLYDTVDLFALEVVLTLRILDFSIEEIRDYFAKGRKLYEISDIVKKVSGTKITNEKQQEYIKIYEELISLKQYYLKLNERSQKICQIMNRFIDSHKILGIDQKIKTVSAVT